jgi:hypothetical protein
MVSHPAVYELLLNSDHAPFLCGKWKQESAICHLMGKKKKYGSDAGKVRVEQVASGLWTEDMVKTFSKACTPSRLNMLVWDRLLSVHAPVNAQRAAFDILKQSYRTEDLDVLPFLALMRNIRVKGTVPCAGWHPVWRLVHSGATVADLWRTLKMLIMETNDVLLRRWTASVGKPSILPQAFAMTQLMNYCLHDGHCLLGRPEFPEVTDWLRKMIKQTSFHSRMKRGVLLSLLQNWRWRRLLCTSTINLL